MIKRDCNGKGLPECQRCVRRGSGDRDPIVLKTGENCEGPVMCLSFRDRKYFGGADARAA